MPNKLNQSNTGVSEGEDKLSGEVSSRRSFLSRAVLGGGAALTLLLTGEGNAQADQTLLNFTNAQEAGLKILLPTIKVSRSNLGKDRGGVSTVVGVGPMGPANLQARKAFALAHPGVNISKAKMSYQKTSDGYIIIYTYNTPSKTKVTVDLTKERAKTDQDLYKKAQKDNLLPSNNNLVFGFGKGALGPAVYKANGQAGINKGNTKRGQYVERLKSTGEYVVLIVGGKKKSEQNKFIVQDDVKPGLIELMEKVDGNRWIGKLEGNGGRDVAIYIPPGADPNKPFEVIYHFHGTRGDLVGEDVPMMEGCPTRRRKRSKRKIKTPRCSANYKTKIGNPSKATNRLQQILTAAKNLNRQPDRNVIVVYPLSAGRRGRKGGPADRNRYDDDWMKRGNSTNDDMRLMHKEVLCTLQSQFDINTQVGSVTAEGHSAGGRPLQHIAASGFKVDKYNFFDANYGEGRGNWAKQCYEDAIKLNPNLEMNLFVRKGNGNHKRALKSFDLNYNRRTKTLKFKKGVEVISTRVDHAFFNLVFFKWMHRKKRK